MCQRNEVQVKKINKLRGANFKFLQSSYKYKVYYILITYRINCGTKPGSLAYCRYTHFYLFLNTYSVISKVELKGQPYTLLVLIKFVSIRMKYYQTQSLTNNKQTSFKMYFTLKYLYKACLTLPQYNLESKLHP